MRTQTVVVVVSAVLLSCSPPPPLDTCGGEVCSNTQFCDRDSLRCVTDERPVISLTVPTTVVTGTTFEVTGSAIDDVGLTTLDWNSGTGEWTSIDLSSAAAFTFTVDAPLIDSMPVVVSVRARDLLGETVNDKRVTVDRVGPELQLVAPVSGSVTNAPTVAVTVKATDGSGALTALRANGQSLSTPMSGVEEVVTLAVPSGLNRQPLVVSVAATDTNGNASNRDFEVLVDNVAPLVEFTMPAAPDQLIASATYTATATVTDPSDVTVEFQLGSGTTVPGVQGAPGVWSALLTIPAIEGAESISVVAIDALGNRGMTSRAVRIDRVAPTVTVTSPGANSIHRSDFTVSVTGSADVVSATATMGSASAVSLTATGTTWSGTIAVPAGDFTARTILFVARDGAGNEGNATLALNTDTVAPVITVTSPSAGQKFKASDFATSANVTVTWTVQDGDASAATTHFEGTPFTGTTRAVTTSATDNPTSYVRPIIAADRAGNTTTVSATFSVDRVVPTIVGWTPANGARNLVNATTVITFSEPVFPLTAGAAPFTITGQTVPAGTWTGNTEFSVSLSSFIYKALELTTVVSVTDGHGNPIPAQTRRLHTATSLAGGVIATGVHSFDAASDLDGVLTIATKAIDPACPTCTSPTAIRLYRDNGNGAVTQVGGVVEPLSYGSPTLNVWNTVDGTTLSSTPRYGLVSGSGLGGVRRAWSGGTDVLSTFGASGAVVSRTPFVQESLLGASAGVALITGASYARSPYAFTLDHSPTGAVSQSNVHVSMFASDGSSLRFSRYWCGPVPPSSVGCADVLVTVGSSATAGYVSAASTASGSCEAISFTNGSDRRFSIFPRPAHETTAALSAPAAFSISSGIGVSPFTRQVRFGRYTWGSEDVILYTDLDPSVTTGGVAVRKLSGCNAPSSVDVQIGSRVLSANEYSVPVQVGSKIGLVRLASDGTLSLSVFP